MILWTFQCQNPDCQSSEDRLIQKNEAHNQLCEICQSPMKKQLSNNKSWSPSQERSYQMLKKRSQDHARRCKEKGIPMTENESGISSDPVWRNKIRQKNTRTDTIERFKNAHVDWTKKPSFEHLD